MQNKFDAVMVKPINNKNKPTNRLFVEIENKRYHIATLSWNLSNNELFYLPHYSENVSNEQLFINTGQRLTRINKISFHKNNTLIKAISLENEKNEEIEIYRDSTPLLPESNDINVFFIDSIVIQNHESVELAHDAFRANVETLVAAMPEKKDFSLIYALVPSHFDSESIIKRPIINGKDEKIILLEQFLHDGFAARRIREAFSGFDLIIIATPHVNRVKNSEGLLPTNPCRYFHVTNPLFELFKMSDLIKK